MMPHTLFKILNMCRSIDEVDHIHYFVTPKFVLKPILPIRDFFVSSESRAN